MTPAGGEVRVIVMSDDIGVGHGVNVGTIDAHRNGIVTTTNVIPPGPWFLEVVRLARENPGLDIGVHIAMTSEWDELKWRPLTGGRTIVDENGYLPPLVSPREGREGANLQDMNPDIAEVEAELRAQIEFSRRHIPRVSYLWPHMDFQNYSPEVASLVSALGREYDIPNFYDVIRDLGIREVKRPYKKLDPADVKAAKLAGAIAALGTGTWLFVDHAATDTPEVRAIFHKGYTEVAADRSANVTMWKHPSVRNVIQQRQIVLISAGDAVAEWRKQDRSASP